jgi:RimJ/RimL family protein N-acetyltransferase
VTAAEPKLDLPPEPIEIAAGAIQLRPWEERLAPGVLTALNDPQIARYSLRPPPADLDAARAWITNCNQGWRDGKNLGFAVHDAVTGELLGEVSLGYLDPLFRLASIGYWTMPDARGKGVASRAVAVVTRWGFQALGLHRIDLGHAVGNLASCRVAEKNGFRREGVQRGFLPRLDGGWDDNEMHARLADDPEP